MNISLDYDNTYTRDKNLWNSFCKAALMAGHDVYCVTLRNISESREVYADLGNILGDDHIYLTDRASKKNFMFDHGISIDVWIDDMPFFIDHDARPSSK